MPRLGSEEDMIFIKDKIISARYGNMPDVESPTADYSILSGREQSFTGADALPQAYPSLYGEKIYLIDCADNQYVFNTQ